MRLQLGTSHNLSVNGRRIISKKFVIVMIHHRHKLSDLMQSLSVFGLHVDVELI
jgi:hypothetical protein